jgi:predicted permease
MRRFGADSSLLGRNIDLSGSPATVVGVMPAGFDFPDRSDAWIPLYLDPSAFNCWCYEMIGRMRPGLTPNDVRREIEKLTDDFFPGAKPGGTRIVATTLTQRLVGSIERQLLILLAAVGCVLLIACANIANLLLARTARRARELAVRCCLGASPGRIATQLLTESLLLSLGGATVGSVLAAWGTTALRQLPTKQFPRIDQVHVDSMVLAATVSVALLAGILCGLVPAWRATRVDLQHAIKNGMKGSDARASRRTSNSFVVAQFALSLVLLVGAGLLLRSYERLSRVNTGYHTNDVLTARVGVPWPRYDSAQTVRAFYERLVDQVRTLPGVRAVGIASAIPLTEGNTQDNIIAEGKEPRSPNEPVRVANIRMVTPGYFAAIGTPLRRGRVILPSDDEHAPRVAVVDELFAKHFWPGEDPIGKRFYHGGDTSSKRLVTVVGVVANVKHARLDEAGDLQVYEPFAQFVEWDSYLVVRTTTERSGLVAEIRRAMKSIDAAVPLYDVRTMREAVDQSLGTRRLTDALLAGFSLTALILAAIGIYGVMSLGVNGRLREFGIRLALGAKPDTVRALVLRQASWLALGGVVTGLVGALATTRYLRALLFGVGPLDWLTFASVAALLAATALVASYVPARRATRADPMLALRAE